MARGITIDGRCISHDDEFDEAVVTARDAGAEEILLLKCTSTYPADPTDSNLLAISDMEDHFDLPVGLSDHTPGSAASVAAVALGAVAVEKHVTLSREDGGVDAAFSLEPAELVQLVRDVDIAWRALGRPEYGPTEHERASLHIRQSLWIAEDARAGDVLTPGNLRIARPGLEPKHFQELLGKRLAHDVRKGTPVTWKLVE